MYVLDYLFQSNPQKKILIINNLSFRRGFRDGKDTKCWITTDVPLKENMQTTSSIALKLSDLADYFV